MQATIQGLTNRTDLNNCTGIIVNSKRPDKVAILLKDTNKVVLCKTENVVVDNKTLDVCSICQDPMLPFSFVALGCKHNFHTACIAEWRKEGSDKFASANARCPLCRSYEGLAHNTDWNKSAMELVSMSLGYIFQKQAFLTNRPEPSFNEELKFVTTAMLRAMELKPEMYDRIEKALIPIRKQMPSRLINISNYEMKLISIAFLSVLGVHLKLMNEKFEDWREACEAWLNVSLSFHPVLYK